MITIGVDVVHVREFGELLFVDRDSITFASLIDSVLQIRGKNQATVKDIIDLRKSLRKEICHNLTLEFEKAQAQNKFTFELFEDKFSKQFQTFSDRTANSFCIPGSSCP